MGVANQSPRAAVQLSLQGHQQRTYTAIEREYIEKWARQRGWCDVCATSSVFEVDCVILFGLPKAGKNPVYTCEVCHQHQRGIDFWAVQGYKFLDEKEIYDLIQRTRFRELAPADLLWRDWDRTGKSARFRRCFWSDTPR